jgi:hypothetical protein
MKTRAITGSLLCLLSAALVLAAPAQANRALNSTAFLKTLETGPGSPAPLPDGQVEAACGLALGGGSLYVSDYYHGAVDLFKDDGNATQSRLLAGTPPEGPCGLARTSAGALYANLWHQSVVRLTPSPMTVDADSSTGVAADAAGNVYVTDRTYVAKYEAPVEPEEAPVAKIGVGSLGDAYGLAVTSSGGRLYVPDAATGTIKVYEPSASLTTPVATITGAATPKGKFVSLVDAAVAIDPASEHLIVADNIQPGYEHPKAAIYEFELSGAFLGQLPGAPVHGEPTGLTFAGDGTLYVTSGNDELANVFKYAPYSASLVSSAEPGETPSGSSSQPAAATQSASLAIPGPIAVPVHWARGGRGQTELVQKGPIRVAVSGGLAPQRLPRRGAAPISVTIGGHISSTEPQTPPQLRTVSFAFNRAGRIDTRGLPVCHLTDIDPSSTQQAREACGRSTVGEGLFAANVRLPEQSPFPSAGKVVAFNGTLKGEPVIFAHIYGTKPVPTSIVLPLKIRHARGTFATRLDASLASLTGDWGYVESITLRLGRKFHAHGERRSFLSAGCPAPKGFPGALFPLARASFSFVGGRTLTATLTRSCTVRG